MPNEEEIAVQHALGRVPSLDCLGGGDKGEPAEAEGFLSDVFKDRWLGGTHQHAQL
jgi:hypothetical protein